MSPELGGLYYEPTLFTDVRQEMEIVQREVFGPVLTLQTFADDDEAVGARERHRVRSRRDRLHGGRGRAWTGSVSDLVAGTTWINCFYARDLGAPFGGAKRSGIGREGGEWSFDFYADVKTVARKVG